MTEEIPFVALDNETLNNQDWVEIGDSIQCPHCQENHSLFGGTQDGKPSDFLLVYKCGERLFLGAVANRCVTNCFSK